MLCYPVVSCRVVSCRVLSCPVLLCRKADRQIGRYADMQIQSMKKIISIGRESFLSASLSAFRVRVRVRVACLELESESESGMTGQTGQDRIGQS